MSIELPKVKSVTGWGTKVLDESSGTNILTKFIENDFVYHGLSSLSRGSRNYQGREMGGRGGWGVHICQVSVWSRNPLSSGESQKDPVTKSSNQKPLVSEETQTQSSGLWTTHGGWGVFFVHGSRNFCVKQPHLDSLGDRVLHRKATRGLVCILYPTAQGPECHLHNYPEGIAHHHIPLDPLSFSTLHL